MLLFVAAVMFILLLWLRAYTHHGQKLELPDYIDSPVDEAEADARRRDFEIIINDSVHIVGKPGGIIQNQNPKGGAMVKEKRKIYVTTTKYKADQVDISSLFPLYGKDYATKAQQLQQKAIACHIKEYKYDPLTQNTILEVWHNSKAIINSSLDPTSYLIERGSRLEFVISTPEGGSHVIPPLVGRTVQDARFIIESNRFRVGTITFEDGSTPHDTEQAIIVSQSPQYDGISSLTTGSTIDLIVKNEN